MGKVHGSLARAGKVRGQTPKVAKQDKKKKPRGRAYKRMQYNRRFVTAVVGFGKKRGPNSSEKYSQSALFSHPLCSFLFPNFLQVSLNELFTADMECRRQEIEMVKLSLSKLVHATIVKSNTRQV
ncbi:hypothetical protein GQ457_14G006660 [Hibiscus cannabinus]